jgi:aspartyl-tRNA(Asn)/glutamyl-tRNA(Gln) amidotransferase subunit A
MPPDLHTTRQALREGRTTLAAQWDEALAIARSPACAQVFRGPLTQPSYASNQPLAGEKYAQAATEIIAKPLAGLPISVKDLFDVEGLVSAAGSQALADAPPALADCPAVARLRAAGGGVMGRTHMVEFAFSGVGVNPHFGTPANPADPAVSRVPGGSSSGAAVSVATGAAFAGLGSDTGGSLRIPAALCGIVGFKPTARTVPQQGTVPLSHTLDTVGALTRSVRDAVLIHEILSAGTVTRGAAALSNYRFAVARSSMLDALDATVARAFERTLRALSAAGAQIVEIGLAEIADLGQIQSKGGFAAPEALAWHQAHGLWPAQRHRYDPRVAQRIAAAQGMSAADYINLRAARAEWIARTERALLGFDAVLSPTVPIVAPPIADVAPGAERDAEFFRVNALLLRNPSVVNLLDGCAISLPCHAPDELPVGLMVWAGAMRDDSVLGAALQIEPALHQML